MVLSLEETFFTDDNALLALWYFEHLLDHDNLLENSQDNGNKLL